jgi:hypothetical protein
MLDAGYFKITYDYTVICPQPFADADRDQDVDEDDFGIWQRCYTSLAGPMPDMDICTCLDRNGNDVVDRDDLDAFTKCWSGPAVQAGTACENP